MFIALTTALLFAAEPGAAATSGTTTPAAPEAPQQKAAKAKTRNICKKDIVTTSLYGTRTQCMTEEQWRAYYRQEQDDNGR
jgi:hypothetical protein